MSQPDEKAIFNEARRIADHEARRAYLNQTCGDDTALRLRVEALLQVMAEEPGFLESPPAELMSGLRPTGLPGLMIDRYKLIELIGEGGMGEVWKAEQLEPVKRLVALKLIKAGKDSRQVLARFEAERQALALMDHHSIAKILDGGVTDANQPFFVMELVQGHSITRYCDEQRLAPQARLELFIPVCHAIQHAHQKGIIHRDIKPSNVLIAQVDGRPVPKVIDFGVAKAIDVDLMDVSLETNFGTVVGTPQYMSPEQADTKHKDVDTRTDIYSLGVLLYELLTGSPPFDKKTLADAGIIEMLRVIREVEPPTPSTKLSGADELPSIAANRSFEPKQLTSLMRGELDWIVMRSLEKDRNRRYATANGLARDIERYLHDEPVEAGPPSAGYKLRKFLRRNRGPVIAAMLLFVALVGGIVGTSIGLVRAEQGQKAAESQRQVADRQRDRAERHYKRALSAVDRLLTRVGSTGLAAVPHMDETRRRLLEDALEFYQGFLLEESDDPVVRHELGRAHGRIGTIHEELGKLGKAEESTQKAIEILRRLALEDQNHDGFRTDLLQTQRKLALVWHLTGRSAEAERLTRDILSRELPQSPNARWAVSELQYLLAMICYDTRRPIEAEAAFKRSLELEESVIRDQPGNIENEVGRSSTLSMLGIVCREGQRLEEAEQYYLAARQILELVIDSNSADPGYQFRLAGVLNNLGLVVAAQDRPREAEDAYRKASALCTQLVRDHPDLPEYRKFLASAHNNLGLMYARAGDQSRALEENEVSVRIYEEMMRRYPQRVEFSINFASACGNHAKYLIEQRNWSESIPWNSKAIETLTKVVGTDPGQLTARASLFNSLIGRAGANRTLNQPEKAIEDYRQAIILSEGERHPNYVNFRPRALAFVGEHARATTEAEAVVAKATATASNYKEMANVFANSVEAVRRDSGLNEAERENLAERYARRAIALLAGAGGRGYFRNAEQVNTLRTDERLRPLSERDDFKTLLTDLHKKLSPPMAEKQP